jgi:hypothetical protein
VSVDARHRTHEPDELIDAASHPAKLRARDPTAAPVPGLRPGPFYAGLLLITASTLALEVLDTRLLSVLTWYSLAFLVIAMGLFGLTAGAVHVYLRPERFSGEALAPSLALAARRLAWSIPASYVLLLLVPLRVEAVGTTVVLFVVFSAILALPFYPAGIVVAAALTRSPFPIGRVYAVDLLGAALGAPSVLLLLRVTDGGTAILALGVVAAVGSVLFARAGGDPMAARRGLVPALLLAGLALYNGTTDRGLVPLWVKGTAESRDKVELELWNSHSRVQVLKDSHGPAIFWGKGANCTPPIVHQRDVFIDGHAATPFYLMGLERLRELDFLACDVTNVVHRIRPHGKMAIIGVGGSRDLQAALLAGHRPIVGIELNQHVLDVLRGPYGAATGVATHPDVTLVHDEARSHFARHPARYSVIQASLIDTWAATGAGAHALGENGLYTLEAWRLFLSRLEPDGVLTVSRWASVETARLMALAVGALLELGVPDPRRHIALLVAGPVSTLLVGRNPLTPEDEALLAEVAAERGFVVAVTPSRRSSAERLERALDAKTKGELDDAALLPLLDFRPPTDDRPFFFNVVRLRTMFSALPDVTRGNIEGNLLATRALGLAALASIVLSAIGILWPLARRARPRQRHGRRLFAAFGYFAAIGVGFMLAEIALLQRLTLVLGHPSFSLMVVLASLVGFAGLGALLSDRLPLDRGVYSLAFPVVLASWLVAIALVWPSFAGQIAAAATPARVLASLAITGATGLLLGVAFPTGMRLVRAAHDEETPWLWGINGMGSVVSSSLALMLALEWGLTVVLLVAAGCYLALVPVIWMIRRGAKPTTMTST